MGPEKLGFWRRLWLAILLPWRLLFNPALAARAAQLLQGAQQEAALVPGTTIASELVEHAVEPTPALQLLTILQRDGRFIDFLQEDVQGFSDGEIGAAARVVHAGCKRALNEYLVLEAVRSEAEGEAVVLENGFDRVRHRITGNVVGKPPFKGRLAHHGWQVTQICLPTLARGHDPRIVAPAEVEL